VWVGNVYIPPAQNLTKRNIAEDVARSYVEDITSSFPTEDRIIVCESGMHALAIYPPP
jgi:hypothetical protein